MKVSAHTYISDFFKNGIFRKKRPPNPTAARLCLRLSGQRTSSPAFGATRPPATKAARGGDIAYLGVIMLTASEKDRAKDLFQMNSESSLGSRSGV
jgi:hypothetical protein